MYIFFLIKVLQYSVINFNGQYFTTWVSYTTTFQRSTPMHRVRTWLLSNDNSLNTCYYNVYCIHLEENNACRILRQAFYTKKNLFFNFVNLDNVRTAAVVCYYIGFSRTTTGFIDTAFITWFVSTRFVLNMVFNLKLPAARVHVTDTGQTIYEYQYCRQNE